MNRSGTAGFGDPDAARDAALIDGIGDVRRALRLSLRGVMQDPAYLSGRVVRLAARLREEGGDPGVLVESVDAAALYAEVLRLEGEIGAAMARKREAVMGLDEPGLNEAMEWLPIDGLDEPGVGETLGDEPMAAE
jgi:hypothetical protein